MTDSDIRDDHALASETKVADGKPQWRLTKGEELEVRQSNEAEPPKASDEQPQQASVSPLLAACREIIDRGEGRRSPESSGVTLRELQELLGYRPSRLEVLTQVVSRELTGQPLRLALVLLTSFGMSGAGLWLSLTALYAGAGK